MKAKLFISIILLFFLFSCTKENSNINSAINLNKSNELLNKSNTVDWEEEAPGDGSQNGGSGSTEAGVYWYYQSPAKITINYSRNSTGGYNVTPNITEHIDYPNYSIKDLRIDYVSVTSYSNSFEVSVYYSWTYVGSMGQDPLNPEESIRDVGYASFIVDCQNL